MKTGQESSSSLPTPESPDSWDTVVVGEALRREAGDEVPEEEGEGDAGGEEDDDELGGGNFRVFFEALVRPIDGKVRVAIRT